MSVRTTTPAAPESEVHSGWSLRSLLPPVAIALLHLTFLGLHLAPAISTPDANSYFGQARRIARDGTTSFALESSAQFIGPHWSQTAGRRYHCTHPPGFGLLLAMPYTLWGYRAATWVSPVLASLSLLAIFMLCRQWAGPRWALLATVLSALSPFANEHALFGDAHIAVQFLLLSALVCLARATRDGSSAWVLAAGLLAGAIPTVRYPELLYLPGLGLFVILMAHRGRLAPHSWLVFALGIALPLGALLIRNHVTYGGFWRTGYLATGEQAAFSVAALVQHAPSYLWKLLSEGAGPLLPLGVTGIVVLIGRRQTRGEGLLLAGLILPTTLLYMAWYWRPDPQSMRFLIPTFPLYTLAGIWLLSSVIRNRRMALGASAAVLITVAVWGTPASLRAIRHLERDGEVLADITAKLEQHVPTGSVVIASFGVQQHLDFVGLWKLADASLMRSRPKVGGHGKGVDELTSASRQLQKLPLEERGEAFISAVLEWAGSGDRIFLLISQSDRPEWDRWLPTGSWLVELDSIRLPLGDTAGRTRSARRLLPDGRPRQNAGPHQDALPTPDPDAIFDLELDGQLLLLFELEEPRST